MREIRNYFASVFICAALVWIQKDFKHVHDSIKALFPVTSIWIAIEIIKYKPNK